MPVTFLWMIKQPLNRLQEEDFYNKWGSFYQGVKTNSKINANFFLFFMVRRIILIFIAFWFEDMVI